MGSVPGDAGNVSDLKSAGDWSLDAVSVLLRFVAGLWLRPLDAATFSALQGPLAEPWQEMGGTLPTGSLEQIETEFCALFSNPQTYWAPFESVWLMGQLEGPSVRSMRAYLVQSGYAREVGTSDVPDHLGVQLDLAGWMLTQVAENPDIVRDVVERFAAEHLQWVGPLLDRLENQTTSAFYASLAQVTRGLLSVQSLWTSEGRS